MAHPVTTRSYEVLKSKLRIARTYKHTYIHVNIDLYMIMHRKLFTTVTARGKRPTDELHRKARTNLHTSSILLRPHTQTHTHSHTTTHKCS